MQHRTSAFLMAAGLGTVVCSLAPTVTSAQEASASRQLEEITVTARKREETIQSVPVAVTAVSGERLDEIAATDISALQNFAPNLSIYSGRNQSSTLTAFVRGVGQADPLWGVDPGVGLYIDDVYVARPQGALLDVYDVARVEVLRGPQGTLYGKNTIGGAIKYVTRPLTDDLSASLRATVGDYGTQELRGRLGGALIEGKLRGKISAAMLQRDGYGENLLTGADVSDKDTISFRAALEWLPTDTLSFKLNYDWTEDDANPKGYTRLEANPFCPAFLGEPCEPLPEPFDVEAGLEPLNGTESSGSSLTVDWNLNDAWDFRSITAYRESDSNNNIDFDTTPARITDVVATYYDEQFTQEFQLVYDTGERLAGVIGAFYLDGEAGGLVQNIFFDAVFGTTDGRTETESIALFTDWSYSLSDRWNLILGVRATEEEKRGVAFNAGYSDDTFSEVTAVTADYDKTATFNSVSPKIGFDFRATDDIMYYAHVSRGFKSGGFNVRAQSTFFPESAEPFDDEQLTNLELGMKSTLFDNQLVLNTALFYGEYEDVQVSTFTGFDSTGDGQDDSFFGNFLNAGDATIQGIEVEFAYSPAGAEWLTLDGNINYLDASPDSFLDLNEDGILDTQVITNAPETTGALRANYNFPVGNGAINGFVGVSYRDDSTLTNEGVNPLVQPSLTLWDASIGYVFGRNAKYAVTLHGKNLTDELYFTNGYNIPVLGIRTGAAGAPRVYLLTAEVNF